VGASRPCLCPTGGRRAAASAWWTAGNRNNALSRCIIIVNIKEANIIKKQGKQKVISKELIRKISSGIM